MYNFLINKLIVLLNVMRSQHYISQYVRLIVGLSLSDAFCFALVDNVPWKTENTEIPELVRWCQARCGDVFVLYVALWANTKRKHMWKEACPWHMSNLHPHKKVNTLRGCTDTSCWLSFLLQFYGRCNSYRHHPPVSLNGELSPFWKLSAHIQYLQNTSTSKRAYKGVDKMMENYMLLTLSVAACGGFFHLCLCFMGKNTLMCSAQFLFSMKHV